MLKCRGEVQSGKTLHHDLDPPSALRISEPADEPRCGRKASLAIRVELNCLRCRATAVLSMPVLRAGLEAPSFQHRLAQCGIVTRYKIGRASCRERGWIVVVAV